MRMSRSRVLTTTSLLAVLSLAGCGYDAAPPEHNEGNTTGERGTVGARGDVGGAQASSEGSQRVVRLEMVQAPTPHLVDASGASLYYLEGNADGSKCDQACEDVWPPVLGQGQLQAGNGKVGGKATGAGGVGSLERADADHVTWRGQPLYRYAGDQGAQGLAGDGVTDEWGRWELARP